MVALGIATMGPGAMAVPAEAGAATEAIAAEGLEGSIIGENGATALTSRTAAVSEAPEAL